MKWDVIDGMYLEFVREKDPPIIYHGLTDPPFLVRMYSQDLRLPYGASCSLAPRSGGDTLIRGELSPQDNDPFGHPHLCGIACTDCISIIVAIVGDCLVVAVVFTISIKVTIVIALVI
jgi:hypothetical protein